MSWMHFLRNWLSDKSKLECNKVIAKNSKKIQKAVFQLLDAIGEDAYREGLRDTPIRVARMYAEIFSGYVLTESDVVNGAVFNETAKGMILVKNIEFYSLCEHHMLPFFGKAHIAYFPDKKIIGLSKIPRLVDLYARRLQVQERLTEQISESIHRILSPLGCAVIVEAQHMCSMMRGVKKHDAQLVTMRFDGIFETDPSLKHEFLSLIQPLLSDCQK